MSMLEIFRIEWNEEQKEHLDILSFDAINKWGWDLQKKQLLQELLEFGLSILHNEQNKVSDEDMFGEFVDLEIMMNQFKAYYSGDSHRLKWLRQRRIKLNHLGGILEI